MVGSDRLPILRFWLSGKKNGVSCLELMRFLASPSCAARAKRKIETIVEEGKFLRIGFYELSEPLYWPKNIPLESLYQVVAESLYPQDWHHYFIKEMPITCEDTLVDCGASEGLFSLIAHTRCKHVYAIEPNPSFTEAMRRTFASCGNVEICEAALSDKNAQKHLEEKGAASSISNVGIPVEVTTLDSIFFMRNIPGEMAFLRRFRDP